MKKMYGKVLSFVLAMAMMFTVPVVTEAADAPSVNKSDIVILYDNDVHCAVDGYEDMSALKKEMRSQTKYVSVVSCGDFVQGDVIGSISKGNAIIRIMNRVGYDVVTLGNHEFDYTIPQLKKLMNALDAEVVSCNFTKTSNDKPLYDSYTIQTYGKTKVAFVGITTPESFTKSTPAYFQNSKGEFVYSFAGDATGKALYKKVQKAVNAARKAGADYVVALSHLGTESVTEQWSAQNVVKNTYGIDVVLDGHSHSTIESMKVKNKKGEKITISSTGTKFANIGQLVITKKGKITTKLIPLSDDNHFENEVLAGYIAQMKTEYGKRLEEVIGKTDVDLTTLDADGNRAVRNAETNLGDFCADAFRYALGADIGIMNGGGIRSDVAAGDLTYNDMISVFPFGNYGCVIEVTGQQIKDALELGSKNYPDESGGFLQVSGMKYTIDASIPSSVVTDPDTGMFVKVDGEYRVTDIQIWNSEKSEYEALDLKKTYTLAGTNYTLRLQGDGYTMFDGCNVVKDNIMVDNEVMSIYLQDVLNGVVGEEYKDPTGQGRITVINK